MGKPGLGVESSGEGRGAIDIPPVSGRGQITMFVYMYVERSTWEEMLLNSPQNCANEDISILGQAVCKSPFSVKVFG